MEMNLSGINFHGHSVKDPVHRLDEVYVADSKGQPVISPIQVQQDTAIRNMISVAGNGNNGAPAVLSDRLENQISTGFLPDLNFPKAIVDYVKQYGVMAGLILLAYFIYRKL